MVGHSHLRPRAVPDTAGAARRVNKRAPPARSPRASTPEPTRCATCPPPAGISGTGIRCHRPGLTCPRPRPAARVFPSRIFPLTFRRARGRLSFPKRGAVAQLGERLNGIQEAVSSILSSSTTQDQGFRSDAEPFSLWRGGGFGPCVRYVSAVPKLGWEAVRKRSGSVLPECSGWGCPGSLPGGNSGRSSGASCGRSSPWRV